LKEKTYAENKYGIKVNIISSDYNFKEGSYDTTLQPINTTDITFLVYQRVQLGGEKAFQDSYPEALWGKELNDITLPTIKKLFSDARQIEINISAGSDYSLQGNHIPSYKEVEKVPYQIDLTIENNYQSNENKRIFNMIEFLKKEGFPFGIIFVRYQNKTIYISAEDLNNIQSENDISSY
jgi:hypothetical protein